MKVTVDFIGFPDAVQAIGQKKASVDIAGGTVKDLISELVKQYGEKVRGSFYNDDGSFDPNVQIILNQENYVSLDQHDTQVREGDHVTFMLVMAGG